MFNNIKNIIIKVLIKLGFKNVAHYINGPVKLGAFISKEEEQEIFKMFNVNYI